MKLSHGKKTDAVIKPEASKAPTATTCKFKSGPRSRNINMEGVSRQLIAFAKALLSALPPICFVVGTVLIIRGLIRFGQANSRVHGGKGALSYIVIGTFIMNANLVIQLIVNTLGKAGINVPGI